MTAESLNERAMLLVDTLVAQAADLGVHVVADESGARIVDCGAAAAGSREAGRQMAEICMAGWGQVSLVTEDPVLPQGAAVRVESDRPIAACMAAQYAGWQILHEGYFAMGSGPMRAAGSGEELFERIGCRERPACAVGALEAKRLPPAAVCRYLAERCGVPPTRLSLLVARTASEAGTLQVTARSLETALHKMHVLGFDLARVERGIGLAPLPPVAGDDLTAIGWTNDAILYGGRVTLWLRGAADAIDRLGPQIPSSSSPAFGEPFLQVFERFDRDFYKIDPHLFSPAEVRLIDADSGRAWTFGEVRPDVLRRSLSGG